MAQNQYISVKVCGNPDSNSGFIPLLLFNNPSFAVEDSFYVGFDKCSHFYTIKTTQTQTIYKLIKNNVRSYGAARPGSLVIAFSVPKNYALAGGYTPYDVLNKLKDEFLKRCMTCKDPVSETYEFNPGRIDQHVLDEASSVFSLIPAISPNRVMTPSAPKGYIVRGDAEIKEMFHDTNYPEFDKYSEVIVAESVSQTNYALINNLQIPRPKNYAIYVDGVLKMSCPDVNTPLKFLSQRTAEYYDNKSYQFTIQNLKDGDVFPGVKFQEELERIDVSTQDWATPKRRKINIKVVPADFESYIFTHIQLCRLIWPYGEIKIDSDFSFTLVGDQIAEIKKNTISFNLAPNDKCKLVDSNIFGDDLRVTVSGIKPAGTPKTGETGLHKNLPQVCDITILLKGRNIFNAGTQEVNAKLKSKSGKSDIVIATCRIKFRKVSEDIWEGHFLVQRDCLPVYPTLCFRIGKYDYTTHKSLTFVSEKSIVEDKDLVRAKVGIAKKKILFYTTAIAALLLLGFVLGLISHERAISLFRGGAPEDVSADSLSVPPITDIKAIPSPQDSVEEEIQNGKDTLTETGMGNGDASDDKTVDSQESLGRQAVKSRSSQEPNRAERDESSLVQKKADTVKTKK